ncbi:MAG: hypothetical protein KIT18_01805 [Burkholderiales bacterium]|nr:hypothetical protein [Burkholderiales bacterium]
MRERSRLSKVVAAFLVTPEVENLLAVRNQLMLRWFGVNGSRALAVVSAGRGDGRSWTTANLAGRLFSQLGERTLLIDGDLRRPRVYALFGMDGGTGLTTLLWPQRNDSISISQVRNLSVLPSGAGAESQRLIARPAFGRLMEDIKARFDVILFDTPAASDCADAQMLAVRAGLALVVACDRQPDPRSCRAWPATCARAGLHRRQRDQGLLSGFMEPLNQAFRDDTGRQARAGGNPRRGQGASGIGHVAANDRLVLWMLLLPVLGASLFSKIRSARRSCGRHRHGFPADLPCRDHRHASAGEPEAGAGALRILLPDGGGHRWVYRPAGRTLFAAVPRAPDAAHFPCVLSRRRRGRVLGGADGTFLNLAVMIAFLGLCQCALQFLVPAAFMCFRWKIFAPAEWRVSGFNMQAPITYGADLCPRKRRVHAGTVLFQPVSGYSGACRTGGPLAALASWAVFSCNRRLRIPAPAWSFWPPGCHCWSSRGGAGTWLPRP